MSSPGELLFAPLSLRPGTVAKNRVWLAPLTNKQSHADGTLSDDELRFLSARADGGFGLVETCAAYVAEDGKAWRGQLGVCADDMIPGLSRLAARIHQGGALAAMQLFHGGMHADPEVSGRPRWSASAGDSVRAATEGDIAGVIEAFAAAARRCAKAGLDAVEVHAAHGYLPGQFLSTVDNRRADGWGGTLENRARLVREIVRAVRAAAPGLVLGVRLSPEDHGSARGLDLDESVAVARWLAGDGMDVLHLSLWRAALPTQKRPDCHPTPLFRDAVGSGIPIVVAGGLWTRDDAEAQLALGADAIALGRAAIANHDWPRRAQANAALNRPPLSPATLAKEGLSPPFVEYLRRWKDFVTAA